MNVLRYELRHARLTTLCWIIGIIAFTSMYLSVYPAFSNDVEQLQKTFANLPEAMRHVMGVGVMDRFTFLGFFGNVFPFITLIGGIMALILGFGALSKEQRFKTTEFLLTKPRSRSSIYLQKIVSSVLVLVVTQLVVAGAAWLIAQLVGAGEFSGRRFMMFWGAFALIQFWLFAFAVAISQLIRRIKSTVAPALGLGFGFFIAATLGAILGDDTMRWLTPFRFIDYGQIVTDGTYDDLHVMYIVVGILVFLGASYLTYTRKDIPSVS